MLRAQTMACRAMSFPFFLLATGRRAELCLDHGYWVWITADAGSVSQ